MEIDSREVVVGITERLRPGLEQAAVDSARVVAQQELNTYLPGLVRDSVYAATRPRHVWRVWKWQLEWTLRRDK